MLWGPTRPIVAPNADGASEAYLFLLPGFSMGTITVVL